MSPFIAIGGVIMTFSAFYMQVRANRLQREQFLKTLNKDKVEETEKFIGMLGLEKPNEVYGKFQQILNFINEGLGRYSIEDLQEEYDKLPY